MLEGPMVAMFERAQPHRAGRVATARGRDMYAPASVQEGHGHGMRRDDDPMRSYGSLPWGFSWLLSTAAAQSPCLTFRCGPLSGRPLGFDTRPAVSRPATSPSSPPHASNFWRFVQRSGPTKECVHLYWESQGYGR